MVSFRSSLDRDLLRTARVQDNPDVFPEWFLPMMARVLACVCFVVVGACGPTRSPAQPTDSAALQSSPEPPSVRHLSHQLQTARSDHLGRIALWGAVNAVGGLALVLASTRHDRPARWNFGAMSAGWGAVNMGIAAAGRLAGTATVDTTLQAAVAAERTFHDIVLVNLGLNVGYAAVGGVMLAAGSQNIDNAGRWRGFGTSLLVQGAGLLVLDGIAFLASRSRLETLLDVATGASVQVGIQGMKVAVHF